jgi:hypothetical protein
MIQLVGFDGPVAHSIIYWSQEGQDCSKTICYTPEDEKVALNRFQTPSDFYSSYDQATVVNQNGVPQIYNRLNENHAETIAI